MLIGTVCPMYIQRSYDKEKAKSNRENVREVPLASLSEEDAKKHLLDAFSKNVAPNPTVDENGKLVQLYAQEPKLHNGGFLYYVREQDLDQGTGAGDKARKYVNAASTAKPKKVHFNSSWHNLKSTALSQLTSDTEEWETDNPKAKDSYASGSYWDAGHMLANQNGGRADDAISDFSKWVFPQTPAINQGNSMNFSASQKSKYPDTYSEWRAMEQEFYNAVSLPSNKCGYWWLKFDY